MTKRKLERKATTFPHVLGVEGEIGNSDLRDVHLAKEKAENGERAEEDDEDIGDERDEAGVAMRTVVIH